MRKRIKKIKLARKKDARVGLLKSLARALILAGKIKTTKTKAKFAQKYIERLANLAKKNSLVANRRIFGELGDKAVSKKLISEIVPKLGNLNSGFTRVVNLGPRLGDAAPMALLEFVYPQLGEPKVQEAPKETRPTPEATEGKLKTTQTQPKASTMQAKVQKGVKNAQKR